VFVPERLPPIIPPPGLLPDPLLPLMPPPLFGRSGEVLLEFEHPTTPTIASALSQSARTNIIVYLRIVAPFAGKFVPAGEGPEPPQVQAAHRTSASSGLRAV
jgi:hypothetical protein